MGSLTDIKIRNLKPRLKPYQVADGDGLILEVRPSGQKAWLYRYRVHGRQEKLSLGGYPEISLGRARELHFDARKQAAEGKSPAKCKREEKRRLSDDLQTVRGLAMAYIDDHVSKLASSSRAQAYIEQKILPTIGGSFLHEVTPADCVAIIEKIKRGGAPAVARKVLEQLRGLFGYAVDRHLLVVNPAAQVRAARIIGSKPPRERTLSSTEIGRFLRTVDAMPTCQSNRIAFRLILLTLCRKGELIKTKWEDVDFDRAEWRMPQDNVKTRNVHIVYLSRQALALFSELRGLAGRSPWVLPGRDLEKPISLTTLNQVIYVAKKKPGQEWLGDIWIHDLRRTASTHLHEMGWDSDVIEKALNHAIGGIRGVYNRAQYAEARREMLQAWANYIDGMESGGNVVPLRQQK